MILTFICVLFLITELMEIFYQQEKLFAQFRSWTCPRLVWIFVSPKHRPRIGDQEISQHLSTKLLWIKLSRLVDLILSFLKKQNYLNFEFVWVRMGYSQPKFFKSNLK